MIDSPQPVVHLWRQLQVLLIVSYRSQAAEAKADRRQLGLFQAHAADGNLNSNSTDYDCDIVDRLANVVGVACPLSRLGGQTCSHPQVAREDGLQHSRCYARLLDDIHSLLYCLGWGPLRCYSSPLEMCAVMLGLVEKWVRCTRLVAYSYEGSLAAPVNFSQNLQEVLG
jgi:hypothetical protein